MRSCLLKFLIFEQYDLFSLWSFFVSRLLPKENSYRHFLSTDAVPLSDFYGARNLIIALVLKTSCAIQISLVRNNLEIENTPDTVPFNCRKAADYNPEPLLLPRVLLSLWALLPLPHAGHGPGPPLPASQLPQSPQVCQAQCCGSGMCIPNPNFFHPGFRICIKDIKYF